MARPNRPVLPPAPSPPWATVEEMLGPGERRRLHDDLVVVAQQRRQAVDAAARIRLG